MIEKSFDRIMRAGTAIVLAASLFSCLSSSPQDGESVDTSASVAAEDQAGGLFDRRFSQAELQADFTELQRLITMYHPKLYTDREAIERLSEENYGRIRDGMTELDFYRLLAPIVASLNCGHSSISLSQPSLARLHAEGVFFPLPLYLVGRRAFITMQGFDAEISPGAEILSINGRSMATIIEELFDSMCSDGTNETYKYMINRADGFMYWYRYLLDDDTVYEIAYRNGDGGEVSTTRLSAATMAEINHKNPEPRGRDQPPCSTAFTETYALIRFAAFYPQGVYTIAKYKQFIDDFFRKVMDSGIPTVILDVRDNFGGDPNVTSHLFSYLARTSQPYFSHDSPSYYPGLKNPVPLAANRFRGRLITLMNGLSFSSTGHLLALLKYQDIGTFVGEESGGSFACTDSSQDFYLPNTRLRFRSSTQIWLVATEGLTPGRGIMPDHAASVSVEDYLAGRDVVMEYAVTLAETGE